MNVGSLTLTTGSCISTGVSRLNIAALSGEPVDQSSHTFVIIHWFYLIFFSPLNLGRLTLR